MSGKKFKTGLHMEGRTCQDLKFLMYGAKRKLEKLDNFIIEQKISTNSGKQKPKNIT